MTIKQAFIGIVTAIALVIAVLISQIVRINTMTGDLQEAQTRIEALETKAAATPKPTATPEPSTEPTATPEPVVYVVSPVSEFNAYNVEAAPYYWLPVPDAEADGTTRSRDEHGRVRRLRRALLRYAAGWHVFLYSAVGRSASARGYSGADPGTHTRACTGERGGNSHTCTSRITLR